MAGPDRPVPQPSKPSARSGTGRPATGTSAAGSSSQTSISAAAAGMSSGVADLYNRLGSALAERGYASRFIISKQEAHIAWFREMLGDLQQSMDSLEQGSKSMVEQVSARLPIVVLHELTTRSSGKETGGPTRDEELVRLLRLAHIQSADVLDGTSKNRFVADISAFGATVSPESTKSVFLSDPRERTTFA